MYYIWTTGLGSRKEGRKKVRCFDDFCRVDVPTKVKEGETRKFSHVEFYVVEYEPRD
jgi:hypothetical protein